MQCILYVTSDLRWQWCLGALVRTLMWVVTRNVVYMRTVKHKMSQILKFVSVKKSLIGSVFMITFWEPWISPSYTVKQTNIISSMSHSWASYKISAWKMSVPAVHPLHGRSTSNRTGQKQPFISFSSWSATFLSEVWEHVHLHKSSWWLWARWARCLQAL